MPIAIREIYGLPVLDCSRLHAALSPAQCRDNFTNAKCLACRDCPVGAELSGNAKQPSNRNAWRKCCRCEAPASRLVGGLLCVSCYNRQREVLLGRNGKGQVPVRTAATLHHFEALIQAGPDACQAFVAGNETSLLSVSRYSPTAIWLSGMATGADELCRLVNRNFAGGTLIDFDVSGAQ